MPGWINMAVRVETRERLDRTKKHPAISYDKLINELLDKVETPPIIDKSKPTT